MNKVKRNVILNTLSLGFALVMNALSGSVVFDGKSVGSVSAKYQNLFTPAGYAFAIWGIIYLLLIAYVVYQWVAWFRYRRFEEIEQAGLWFSLANVANGLWIIVWLNNLIGLSVIFMLVLLVSLVMVAVRLKMELWDAPLRIIVFVWWPLSVYLGWIIAATVANITVYLVSTGWNGGVLSPQNWAIMMIGVATIIYLLLIRYRNMREAAMVGVWAFIAIAVRQWGIHPGIVGAAIVNALLLVVVSASQAFKRWETLPHNKKKGGYAR